MVSNIKLLLLPKLRITLQRHGVSSEAIKRNIGSQALNISQHPHNSALLSTTQFVPRFQQCRNYSCFLRYRHEVPRSSTVGTISRYNEVLVLNKNAFSSGSVLDVKYDTDAESNATSWKDEAKDDKQTVSPDKNHNNKTKTQESQWRNQLNKLCSFRDHHGHTRVTPSNAPTSLLFWVRHQRRLYRQNKLSRERMRLLEDLNFQWTTQDATWESLFAELIRFRSKHGHTLVPCNYSECPKLYKFVMKQRKDFRQLAESGDDTSLSKSILLTPERIERLESIGFKWDTTQKLKWTEMYEKLQSYKLKHGDCLVPTNYPDDPELARWVHIQRCKYLGVKFQDMTELTSERIRKLTDLGFTWSIQSYIWNLRLEQLESYLAKHGHVKVGSDDPELRKWIWKQQLEYRLLKQGKKSNMTQKKIEQLEDLGIEWPDSFKSRINELVEYMKEHGTCFVERRYNPSLSKWVIQKRLKYHQIKRVSKEGDNITLTSNSMLPDWQIEALDNISFDWGEDTFLIEWNNQLEKLQKFRENFGHCYVSNRPSPRYGLDARTDRKLGKWMCKIRVQYQRWKEGKSSDLTLERIQDLNALDFEWNQEAADWNDMYYTLQEYQSVHGNCAVPSIYDNDPALGKWYADQKVQYDLFQRDLPSAMNEERRALLDELGLLWDEEEDEFYSMFRALQSFHSIHGHCVIPTVGHDVDQKLAAWVIRKRQQYALRQEQLKKGVSAAAANKGDYQTTICEITHDEIEALNKLDFVWDTEKAEWDERYRELLAYRDKHGHSEIPLWFPANPRLGSWVFEQQRQRTLYVEGSISSTMTEARQKLLEDAGIVWRVTT